MCILVAISALSMALFKCLLLRIKSLYHCILCNIAGGTMRIQVVHMCVCVCVYRREHQAVLPTCTVVSLYAISIV